MTGIYKIETIVNSKVYIGASQNIEDRWWYHKNGHTAIAEDLQTFGLENFKFEVLLECPEDMLCQWERDMICLYDSDDPEKGYNSKNDRPYNPKVSEVLKGRVTSEEHKRKLSEAHRGIPHLEETKRKISEANKGPIVSEETRRKISDSRKGHKAWNKGLKVSDETKRRISEVLKGKSSPMKGKHLSEETKRKISEARKEYWRKKKELNENQNK